MMKQLQALTIIATATLCVCDGFTFQNEIPLSSRRPASAPTALRVSELHIPGYRQSKIPFILKEEDLVSDGIGNAPTLTKVEEMTFTAADYESQIPYETGYLLHKTIRPVFTADECQGMIDEAEKIGATMGWTTKRHGNYPTTDIPIVELPSTLRFLRKALEERIYPLLRAQFADFLPDGKRLRVADGFVVKYDAEGGQTELKPHRDGSVVSFNIALNPAAEFDGGGTWFESLGDSVKIDIGQVCSHASAVKHGGHGITRGKRYIMVCFVILEGYDSWSMRFYNNVRDL